MPQTLPTSTKAARGGDRAPGHNILSSAGNPPSADTKSEVEQQQRREQFVDYCADLLVPKQKRKDNMLGTDKAATGTEIESVDKTAKFVQDTVKKSLYGEDKYNRQQQTKHHDSLQPSIDKRKEEA